MRPATKTRRRSGRIQRQIDIQVSGTDARCRDFIVPARALVLSRYGAKILLMPELVPDQEINISCPVTGNDQEARVVGLFTKEAEGFTYGVEFLDGDANFWGIAFPAEPASGNWARMVDATPPKSTPRLAGREATPPTAREIAPPARLDVSRPTVPRESSKVREPRNYAVRLQCPLGDQDQWVVLPNREETIQQILDSRWDFECPIHGVQQEFPLDVKETPLAISPWSQTGESKKEIEAPAGVPDQSSPAPFRQEPRTPYTRRVWVRGSDRKGNPFKQTAYSVDVSRNGGRLDGPALLIQPGSTIEVQRGWQKALFRVVWIGQMGTPQANEIGIYCLEPEKNIWGLP